MKIIIGIAVVVAIALSVFALKGGQQSVSDTIKNEAGTKMAADTYAAPVKEFSMTSYYDDDGKWFSLKEISVKKGDRVRIKVTNTKGTHDFTLDEYGIKEATPLGKETIIEFTADKAGEFTYYCSMPGHRQGGQFGTLIVTE